MTHFFNAMSSINLWQTPGGKKKWTHIGRRLFGTKDVLKVECCGSKAIGGSIRWLNFDVKQVLGLTNTPYEMQWNATPSIRRIHKIKCCNARMYARTITKIDAYMMQYASKHDVTLKSNDYIAAWNAVDNYIIDDAQYADGRDHPRGEEKRKKVPILSVGLRRFFPW